MTLHTKAYREELDQGAQAASDLPRYCASSSCYAAPNSHARLSTLGPHTKAPPITEPLTQSAHHDTASIV